MLRPQFTRKASLKARKRLVGLSWYHDRLAGVGVRRAWGRGGVRPDESLELVVVDVVWWLRGEVSWVFSRSLWSWLLW